MIGGFDYRFYIFNFNSYNFIGIILEKIRYINLCNIIKWKFTY